MLLLPLFWWVNNSWAQLPHGGRPFPLTGMKAMTEPLIFDDFCLEKALETSLSPDAVSGKKPFAFAWNHETALSPGNSGEWQESSTGTRIWRLHLRTPGALAVNVNFSRFRIKEGIMVFLYPPEQDFFLGGFNYLNNNSADYLPVGFIPGESVIIEMQVPPGYPDFGELEIGALGHAYIDVFGKDGYFGRSGNCNVNINCPQGADYQEVKKAVCRIIFRRGASTELCTGTLINNLKQDTIPYLYTANHCIRNATEAASALFYFDYESPECLNRDDTLLYILSGSSLKATSDSIDFTLLQLNESPPASYNPYFGGWTTTVIPAFRVVCIHHPQGDVKKISLDSDQITPIYQSPIPENLDWLTEESVPEAFWRVIDWDLGTTEGGSSGSPLFNQDNLIIGNLTGGEASCANSVNDYFSKFYMAWDYYSIPSKQLKYWLDPDNSGLKFVGGFQPFDFPDSLINPSDQFFIYPNPATSFVTFETDSQDISGGVLFLYTINGKRIAQYSITADKNIVFDISFLDQGIYVLEFSKGTIRERRKLFVMNPGK